MGKLSDDFLDNYGANHAAAPATGAAPSGKLPDDFLDTYGAKAPEPAPDSITADTPWSDVLHQAAKNFVPDIGDYALTTAKGLYRAAAHPILTGEGIGSLAKGTYDYFAGNDTPDRQVAENFGNQIYHDYMTEEGWKQGIGEHPFARAMDVGTLMTAPELTADKLGLEGAAKVMNMANPTTWTEKAAGAFLKGDAHAFSHIIGHFGTHSGSLPLQLGVESGLEGDASFVDAIRQQVDPAETVNAFQGALNDGWMAAKKRYRSGMVDISKDKQQLSMMPAFQALEDADAEFTSVPGAASAMPGVPGASVPMKSLEGAQTQGTRYAIRRMLNQWNAEGTARHQELNALSDDPVRGLGHNEWYTPEGMDQLKQNLQVIRDGGIDAWGHQHPGIDPTSKDAVVAGRVLDAVRDEIKTNSPKYAEEMKAYSDAKNALNEYKKELSLGANGNPGTAFRKLLSSLRNNVASSFNYRKRLVDELVAQSPQAKKALYQLAGHSLNSMYPRGLVGAMMSSLLGEGALAMGAHMLTGVSPFAFAPAALITQSPYLMGRFAHGMGAVGRRLDQVPWRQIMSPLYHYGEMTDPSGMADTATWLAQKMTGGGG